MLRMDLHRVGKRPDWELIPKEKRNVWQRMAAGTKGIVTPANVTSVAGAVLVGLGLWRVYFDDLSLGLVLIAIGRLADILDGAVAQATGTKSNVGEALDASVDKITVIAALGILISSGVIPVFAAILMTTRNGVNIGLSLVAKMRKKILHPSRAGKLAGGLEWVSILFFVLSAFAAKHGNDTLEFASFALAYIVLTATLALGLRAIKNYGLSILGKG
jgi:CDP-diacylglycerol---glycerol-3-phosphate 3-phosphatidyltransferase